jgi:hypothetical protein
MSAKLSLHCQEVPWWAGRFLERAGCAWVKGVGLYPAFPGVATVGRAYYDQARVDARVREGAAGADAMFDAVWPEVAKNPQVAVWETPANEPSVWDPSVLAGLPAFSHRMAQRFHAAGKKVVAGAVNTGWPRLPEEDGGAQMRALALACAGADGLSFHEYAKADMRGDPCCLRYRRFHDYVRGEHPPIFITECGLDRPGEGCPSFGHCGWKTILGGNERAYVDQLAWYEAALREDAYVAAAFVFTAGPLGWWDFEVTEPLAALLAEALRDAGPGPDPDPEPGGNVEVTCYDGTGAERDEAWLRANYGAVAVSGEGYGRVELRESVNGSTALTVTLKGKDGGPLPGQQVRFSWPDGSVVGVTDGGGAVGFGMGQGAYYRLPGKGPHWIESGGTTVDGLGFKWGTNHDHLNPTLVKVAEPPPDDRARGFFASDHQGAIPAAKWREVRALGYSYVHLRASAGLAADGQFAANWDGAGAAGLLRSAWHYLVPGVDGQARFFLDAVGDREPELGLYGDFEERDLTVDKCEQFLAALDAAGVRAGVYTSAGWLDPRGSPA